MSTLTWAQPAALSYASQKTSDPINPTFIHSGICTVGGGTVWDKVFADMAAKSLGNNYNEVSFAFMQCFGGGMIDELQAKGFTNASYTSAARHNQLSWAWPQPSGILESTYNLPYAPKAGSAAPLTQSAAATFARANDFYGPFLNNVRTDPQFTSDGAIGDAITLHRNSGVNAVNNTAYKSILFGGSGFTQADLTGNGNSLARISTNLGAAGYVAADVRSLFATNPANTRTTFAGMAKAWRDLGAVLNNTTQVFFWSSWGHGTQYLDKVGKRKFEQANQAPKKGVAFQTSFNSSGESLTFFQHFQDIYDFWHTQGRTDALPYFEMLSDRPLLDPTVSINGNVLPLIESNLMDIFDDGTMFRHNYRFGIDLTVYSSITPGDNTYLIDYLSGGPANGDLDFMSAGVALGDFANGLAVPEPVSMVLLGVIGLALLRRREV